MTSLILNGEQWTTAVNPATRLSAALRESGGALDVKEGCLTGHCGACTILLDGQPVKSCLLVSGQAEGRSVISLKGLSTDPVATYLQESFSRAGAVQCGFCTPGMIIVATALVKASEVPLSRDDIRAGLVGNLCRCTGYHKIVTAVEEASYVHES